MSVRRRIAMPLGGTAFLLTFDATSHPVVNRIFPNFPSHRLLMPGTRTLFSNPEHSMNRRVWNRLHHSLFSLLGTLQKLRCGDGRRGSKGGNGQQCEHTEIGRASCRERV